MDPRVNRTESVEHLMPGLIEEVSANMQRITAACVECKALFPTMRIRSLKTGQMMQAELFCATHRKPDPICAPVQRDFDAEWRNICHGHFLDTDPERIPECIRKPFRDYRYSNLGICAVGPTRTYKSRTMHLLMRKLFWSGKRVKIFTGIRLGIAIAESWEASSYSVLLDTLTSVSVLFVDDIDKAKMTERVLEGLFTIFDERLSKRLPTFFTTNIRGSEMERLFPANAGEAFRRRISEGCIQIETEKILRANGLWDDKRNAPKEVHP